LTRARQALAEEGNDRWRSGVSIRGMAIKVRLRRLKVGVRGEVYFPPVVFVVVPQCEAYARRID
jgi:hypothetical protein